MIIKREKYLKKLISHKNNNLIKIITGIRRSGKSFLLFELFKNYLIDNGVSDRNIIEIRFDDFQNKNLRNPENCNEYVRANIQNNHEKYYVLLDEVQLMDDFEDVLSGFLHIKNADIYITGSNSKFLSSDIVTEFRGRGDEIRLYPLNFMEYNNAQENKSIEENWKDYYTFGGLPYIPQLDNDKEKIAYLTNLYKETYLVDIIERNDIKNSQELENVIDILASSIGSLTNPQKLEKTFKSKINSNISAPTVKKYLNCLEDAFLIKEAKRYDVKGKKYIDTPLKYYFEDIGLRNAKLNFRQQEQTHIMENIIFNELRYRDFAVDVGVIEIREKDNQGKYLKKQTEIDFIANLGSKKYYVQSAFDVSDEEKRKQEERPLNKIDDSFKKIIVIKDNIKPAINEKGILTIGITDFLLNQNSLDF